MRRILSASGLISVLALAGCQSWSQMGQGYPVGSRVPPPGTGTYNPPTNYYNGTKAGTASTTVPAGNASVNPNASGVQGRTAGFTQGQTPNEVVPASYQVPTVDQMRAGINNTAGAVLNNMTSRANQAIQNGTARAANTVEQYTTPLYDNSAPAFAASAPNGALGPASSSTPGSASQSISDAPLPSTGAASPPKLDWQTPR